MPSELGKAVLQIRVSDPHGLLDEIERCAQAVGELEKALNAGCGQQQAAARLQGALESLAGKVRATIGAEPRKSAGCRARSADAAN
jgi:hypothetical protein